MVRVCTREQERKFSAIFRCEEQSDFIVQLNGQGCVRYRFPRRLPSFHFPWQHELSFRTFDSDAVLMYIVLDQRELMKLTLKVSAIFRE